MGLLTTWSDANKVVEQGLAVRYSAEKMLLGNWRYWKLCRYATKQYEYVGMDYNTALSCANEKIQKYTRLYSVIGLDEELQDTPKRYYTTECTSQIAAKRVDGCMYKTVIQVNETDETSYLGWNPPADIASQFTAENQRNYD